MAQATAHTVAHAEGQQHPIKLLSRGLGLAVHSLSLCSYLVDYFHLQGILRWSLICLFMTLKAGLIVAVFMHMAWERLMIPDLSPPGPDSDFYFVQADDPETVSHSCSFDHRRRPDTFRTAIATALFCPTITTSSCLRRRQCRADFAEAWRSAGS